MKALKKMTTHVNCYIDHRVIHLNTHRKWKIKSHKHILCQWIEGQVIQEKFQMLEWHVHTGTENIQLISIT